MSRVRFATADALFETFPEASRNISVAPTDQPPLDFLKHLSAQGKLEDAATFCGYLLPRREAVWWSCGCVRTLLGDIAGNKAAGLLAAEAWVRKPETDLRLAALDIANQGDPNDPMTWLAFAAGWSGGVLFPHPETPVPMPTYMTPRAVRFAILLGAHYLKPPERTERLRVCIGDGIQLAETGL